MKNYFLLIFLIIALDAFSQKQQEVIPSNKFLIVYSDSIITANQIDTIFEYHVFLISEIDNTNSKWIMVDIPSNSMFKMSAKGSKMFKNGFVKKSEIRLVDDLPEIESKQIELEFQINKANSNNQNIDNKYGLDIPLTDSYQVNKMNIISNGRKSSIDSLLYNDIYNVSFTKGQLNSSDNKFKKYKINDIIFIKHNCGDGAGAYEITWTIKEGKIIQRLIDDI